jgi:uncharacterized protein YndB with AHSA1/START domain
MSAATVMKQPSVIHNTFVIERSYPKPPETVFAAFQDPVKKRRWFGEGDHHSIESFEMDFRVGGVEKAAYVLKEGTPFPGVLIVHDGAYLDIVPNRRIVTASSMSFAGSRISASLVTIELVPTATGTDLICTHQGAFYEGADGPQIREAGWQSLFDRLAAELTNS